MTPLPIRSTMITLSGDELLFHHTNFEPGRGQVTRESLARIGKKMSFLVPLSAYPACYNYGTDFKKRSRLRAAEYFFPASGEPDWAKNAGKYLYRVRNSHISQTQ